MAKNTKRVKTSKKQVVRNEKGQVIAGTPNPNGRPKGALNFSTKWFKFIEKVAKENNMTPQQVDEQLLAIGFKKAKEGDYPFWRDIHDRLYGKAQQTIDLNADVEINNGITEEEKHLLLGLLK